MISVQAVSERGVMMEKGEESVFDEFRKALHSHDGNVPLDPRIRRFLLNARKRLERGLWSRSDEYRRVEFSPYLKEIIRKLEEEGQA
jgi:hypothetical protein